MLHFDQVSSLLFAVACSGMPVEDQTTSQSFSVRVGPHVSIATAPALVPTRDEREVITGARFTVACNSSDGYAMSISVDRNGGDVGNHSEGGHSIRILSPRQGIDERIRVGQIKTIPLRLGFNDVEIREVPPFVQHDVACIVTIVPPL